MRRAALILAGLAILAVPAVAHSDDALNIQSLADSVSDLIDRQNETYTTLEAQQDAHDALVDAHNQQVDLLEETIGVLNETNAILDCFQMEPVRYKSVTLADGTVARTLVPTKATYPADTGTHWIIHVKRNCKALAS